MLELIPIVIINEVMAALDVPAEGPFPVVGHDMMADCGPVFRLRQKSAAIGEAPMEFRLMRYYTKLAYVLEGSQAMIEADADTRELICKTVRKLRPLRKHRERTEP